MLAFAIFVVTLVLVIWQPKGLGIGWSAMGGALIALLFGVVQLSDVGIVWDIVWDATFTFVALIIISLILDRAGFFGWAALHVARLGNGQGRSYCHGRNWVLVCHRRVYYEQYASDFSWRASD